MAVFYSLNFSVILHLLHLLQQRYKIGTYKKKKKKSCLKHNVPELCVQKKKKLNNRNKTHSGRESQPSVRTGFKILRKNVKMLQVSNRCDTCPNKLCLFDFLVVFTSISFHKNDFSIEIFQCAVSQSTAE